MAHVCSLRPAGGLGARRCIQHARSRAPWCAGVARRRAVDTGVSTTGALCCLRVHSRLHSVPLASTGSQPTWELWESVADVFAIARIDLVYRIVELTLYRGDPHSTVLSNCTPPRRGTPRGVYTIQARRGSSVSSGHSVRYGCSEFSQAQIRSTSTMGRFRPRDVSGPIYWYPTGYSVLPCHR